MSVLAYRSRSNHRRSPLFRNSVKSRPECILLLQQPGPEPTSSRSTSAPLPYYSSPVPSPFREIARQRCRMASLIYENALEEYEAVFSKMELLEVRTEVARHSLKNSHIRSVYWRAFLGVLPVNAGDEEARRHLSSGRKQYQDRLTELTLNPTTTDEDGLDLSINNPLSTDSDSPWSRFFQDSELCDTIKMDLSRTHPTSEFFQSDRLQTHMLNILFVWSKDNPDVSYRQGMNELLSPLLLSVIRDSDMASKHQLGDDLAFILGQEFVESDAYMLFKAMMIRMSPHFSSQMVAAPSGDLVAPIVAKSDYVQNVLLARIDAELHAHLVKVDVHPQLYGLRWLRLLLAREFHIEDVLIVWDAILAKALPEDTDFNFVEYIAVAMLLYIRPFLLANGNTGCLRRMLKFPPVEDVQVLVLKALALQSGRNVEETVVEPELEAALAEATSSMMTSPDTSTREPSPEPNVSRQAVQSARSRSRSPDRRSEDASARTRSTSSSRQNFTDSISSMFRPFTSSSHRSSVQSSNEDLQLQIRTMKSENLRLGRKLSGVISRLQSEIVKAPEEREQDLLVHCLAEAKLIKDVLIGLLPADSVLAAETSNPASDPATANQLPEHPLA